MKKKPKGRKIGRAELEKISAEIDFGREARIRMIQQLIYRETIGDIAFGRIMLKTLGVNPISHR